MRFFTAALVLAGTAAAFPLYPRNTTTCYSGLYIVVARGSEEAAGEGPLKTVADQIAAQVPDSGSVAVVYPASIFGSGGYPDSVVDGINNAKSLIQTYYNACGSGSQIALLGFSQGGNVMTDMLAGGVDKPTPLAAPYTNAIKGVAVFGDPTFTVGQSFDTGNATKSGIFSRGGSSLAMLNTYAPILQSYCMVHDTVCAKGDSLATHSAEVPTFASQAVDFIVGLVQ